MKSLKRFSASHHQLNGSIPDFTNKVNFKELWIRDNQLVSPLPNFPTSIEEILLGGNSFSGGFPNIRGLNNLEILHLSNNAFGGVIPNDIFEETMAISVLDLSFNNFHGPLPSSIEHLSDLSLFIANDNKFNGNLLPRELDKHPLIAQIFAFNNDFDGSVPISWFSDSLKHLTTLVLSNNKRLKGSLPSRISSPKLLVAHFLVRFHKISHRI